MTGVGRKPTDITICLIDCQCSWVQFHTGQRHTVRSFSAGAFATIALCTSVFIWSQLEHWTEHIVCWKFSLRYCIYVHFSQHLCRLVVTQCLSSTHTGIFIESALCFKCSLDNAKRSFSSVIQQCFWKSWSNCSNEVIVLLVKSKYFPVLFYRLDWRTLLCASINISPFPLTMSLTAHVGKFSIPDHKRLLMLLGMFNCIQAEQTIAIRKRKFLYKFSVINNASCHIFVVNAIRLNLNRVALAQTFSWVIS